MALMVNERGQVTGISYTNATPNPETGPPATDPFLWDHGRMIDLGTLGGNFGAPNWLNNHGQVAGLSNLAGDLTSHPFLWDRGVLTDLGTLGGDNGSAIFINDVGDVVGEADLPGSETAHAFLWRRGVMTDLGTLGTNSVADDVNSRGQVVGASQLANRTEPPFRHAFLSENGGPMIDLNTLIPANSGLELVHAFNINERGEIAVIGVPGRCFPDFCGHIFLLIPCRANDTSECEENDEGANAEVQTNLAPSVDSITISPQRRPSSVVQGPCGRMARTNGEAVSNSATRSVKGLSAPSTSVIQLARSE
jgi:probable HAF family extracellular repeat protein